MAGEDERETADGTILYGPDGHTYFIPDQDLAAYRLSDELAAKVQPRAQEESEVSGFSAVNPPAGTDFPLAIHGNFGRRPSGSSLFEPTVILKDVFLYIKDPQL